MLPYEYRTIYGEKDALARTQQRIVSANVYSEDPVHEVQDKYQPSDRKLYSVSSTGSVEIRLRIGSFETSVYEGHDTGLMIQEECSIVAGDVCEILINGVVVQKIEFVNAGCYIFNWRLREEGVEFDGMIKK